MLLAVAAMGVVAVAGTGCGGARYVRKAADEGVVAIPNNSDSWPTNYRTHAEKLMAAHVGDWEIVHEDEVVTGHTTVNRQDTKREATFNGSIPFLPAEKQETTTTTTQVPQKEWQIQYRRRAAAAARPTPPADVIPTGATAPAAK
jgi:hypothetical protein